MRRMHRRGHCATLNDIRSRAAFGLYLTYLNYHPHILMLANDSALASQWLCPLTHVWSVAMVQTLSWRSSLKPDAQLPGTQPHGVRLSYPDIACELSVNKYDSGA
jgi:hypothetical protein